MSVNCLQDTMGTEDALLGNDAMDIVTAGNIEGGIPYF